MPNQDIRYDVRESFVARCDLHQFDEPWDFLPAHEDIRRLPADPSSLMIELRKTYSDEALIEAGVAELDNDGSLRLRAKLNAPGKLVVFIRDRRTDVVVDMLTEMGSVFEDELPIFTASGGEQLLLMPDDEHHEVLVVFSIQDLAVLRACGIPATLAAGMGGLCPADIDQLCETFSLDRKKSRRVEETEYAFEDEAEEESPGTLDPIQRLARFGAAGRGPDSSSSIPGEHADAEVKGAAAEDDSMGKRLVFVIWSPATLEMGPPQGFDGVVTYLKELKQYMGLDLHEVHVWTASSEDVKRLRFFLRYRDAEAARGVLLDSLYERMQGLEYLGKERAQNLMIPADFPDAVLKLRESLFFEGLDGDKARRQREAVQHVERLLHEQVVGPMMDEAVESPGASERAIGLATAQLVQMLLTQSVVINARMAKAISRKGMAGLEALPLEEIKNLLGMSDRVTKLFRELDRCQESNINVIQVSAIPRPKPLALPRFD